MWSARFSRYSSNKHRKDDSMSYRDEGTLGFRGEYTYIECPICGKDSIQFAECGTWRHDDRTDSADCWDALIALDGHNEPEAAA